MHLQGQGSPRTELPFQMHSWKGRKVSEQNCSTTCNFCSVEWFWLKWTCLNRLHLIITSKFLMTYICMYMHVKIRVEFQSCTVILFVFFILLRLQYWEKYWTAYTQSACALYNGSGFNTHTRRIFFRKTDWNHHFLEHWSRFESAWEQAVVLVRCYNTF